MIHEFDQCRKVNIYLVSYLIFNSTWIKLKNHFTRKKIQFSFMISSIFKIFCTFFLEFPHLLEKKKNRTNKILHIEIAREKKIYYYLTVNKNKKYYNNI